MISSKPQRRLLCKIKLCDGKFRHIGEIENHLEKYEILKIMNVENLKKPIIT